MIHPDTEVRYISKEKGYGVVATKLIPKGTITWVQDPLDQEFNEDQVRNLSPFIKEYLEKYSFTNKHGHQVLCWDNGKFVNHSFNPSCFSTPYDFEIAIRDIHPGEELTDDYGYLNVEKPFTGIEEYSLRKTVYPDDILTYHKQWDDLILENAPEVLKTKQILLDLIPKNIWDEFTNAVYNPHLMKSIVECHFSNQLVNDVISKNLKI